MLAFEVSNMKCVWTIRPFPVLLKGSQPLVEEPFEAKIHTDVNFVKWLKVEVAVLFNWT